MKKQLEMVGKFHQQFDIKEQGDYKNGLPDEKVRNLRIALIQEELDELKKAFADGDTIEVADALADLAYVLFGTVRAVGMQDVFEKLFHEVHWSNMSKADLFLNEAADTVRHYKEDRNTDAYISHHEKTDKYLVKRTLDDKLLKSVYYHPANINKILGL